MARFKFPFGRAYRSGESAPSLAEHIDQNIDSVLALQRRQWEQMTPFQRRIQQISRVVGRPAYLLSTLTLVGAWIGFNLIEQHRGRTPIDPPPFSALQGVLTLIALLTTTIVLIAQNRQTKLEQQSAHLDLQVTLLTEQKVTKVIHLIEELRRDLPMVKDRDDPQAQAMQQPADTAEVLSAIEDRGLTNDHPARPEKDGAT